MDNNEINEQFTQDVIEMNHKIVDMCAEMNVCDEVASAAFMTLICQMSKARGLKFEETCDTLKIVWDIVR